MRTFCSWYRPVISAVLIPLQVFVTLPFQLMAEMPAAAATMPSKPEPAPSAKAAHGTHAPKVFKPTFDLSANPTDAEVRMARVFPSPLVPTLGEAVAGENVALSSALNNFHSRTDLDDTSAIETFVQEYPKSRWRMALEYDLGSLHFESGYLSKALAEWKDAWTTGKSETGVEQHAVADSAFGNLANLSAEIGRKDDLKALFDEAKDRGFYGAAAQLVRGAQSGYRKMINHPTQAYKCGPFALDSVRTANQSIHQRSQIIQGAASTAQGTSLAMVNDWANKLSLNYQMAKRAEGSDFIVPSVMHWKVGHFGALVKEKNGKYLVQDPTFAGQELWVSAKALQAETSGYFLVPQGNLPTGWSTVSSKEASTVWGRGAATSTDKSATTNKDKKCDCPPVGGGTPMTSPSIFSLLAALCLQDTPVRYHVPLGPNPDLMVTYTYSSNAPPVPFSSTFGYDWSFEYFSYITVVSQNLVVTLPGSGTETANYSAFDDVNNVYPIDPKSQAQIFVDSPGVYDRHLPDGSRQIYSQADGAGHYFLKQIIDPQGNSLTLNYDTHFRLTSIVDQLTQSTTLTYLSNTFGAAGFYQVSKVTEPFTRFASFTYDSTKTQLTQITDVLGISSSFTYDSSYFVDSLTTPYGKTTFNNYVPTSDSDGESGLRITYPDGTTSITENYVGHELNTYFWDRRQSPSYPDKGAAQITHFQLSAAGNVESGVVGYTHEPLEAPSDTWPYPIDAFPPGAVVYNYPSGYSVPPPTNPPPPPEDNFTHVYTGSLDLPSQAFRVLDNTHTQTYTFNYNPIGKVTSSVDPVGRTSSYSYDGNNIDLLQVRQTKSGNNDLLAKYSYNSQHEPLTYEDGSGRTTTYTYNTAGQIKTITQPSPGETTTYNYDSNGYLTSIDGPLSGSSDVTSFTYDANKCLHTVSDSEGYTLTFAYDAYDRPTTVTYPDGTYDQVTWSLLDPVFLRDRLGHWTQQRFDSLRQVSSVTDPNGHTTKYAWCTCGGLASITDPNGNVTTWQRDPQGRPTVKAYADGKTIQYAYEASTSRLLSTTDALGQVKISSYYDDNSLSGIAYSGAVNTTHNVSFTYDSNYPRLSTVSNGTHGAAGDGVGTYTYSYYPYITDPYGTSTTGAGKVSQITNTELSNATVAYSYDVLGRVTNRTINGAANSATWGYDAMSRVTSIANVLGTFTPAYVDQGAGDKGTTRLASMTYPNGQVTQYSYYSTTNDERLQEIKNLNPSSAVMSQFDYTYDAKGQIASWKRTFGSNPATRYDMENDPAGQLTGSVLKTDSTNVVLHQYYYSYDASGNRTSAQADANVTQATPNNLNQVTSYSAGGPTRFQGTISQPGTVAVNGSAAFQSTSTNFVSNPALTNGTNVVSVVATNGNGAAQTNNYQVVVPPVGTTTPAYDYVGEMTNNGSGQTYLWDAENRLVKITIGSNTYQFAYDAMGRRVSENDNGTLAKQWIWCGSEVCEERDGGNTVTKRFFNEGEQISGTANFYTRDHLGSVREMTTGSGGTFAIQVQYDYDPYGVALPPLQGTGVSDFQYAGMYLHQASGLNLTLFRAYDPTSGRWLSRDPLGEKVGTNVYGYVRNSPMERFDLYGLCDDNLPYNPVTAFRETTLGEFSLLNLGAWLDIGRDEGLKTSGELAMPYVEYYYAGAVPALDFALAAESAYTLASIPVIEAATVVDATNVFNQEATQNLPVNDSSAVPGSGVNMGGGVVMQEEYNGQ